MVETISIFFVTMSVAVLIYLLTKVRAKNRLPLLVEIFFLITYSFVMMIFLFPHILVFIEDTFGLASAINFFIYLSIFVGYLMIFILYQKTERQREQITRLNRELALREAVNEKSIEDKKAKKKSITPVRKEPR
jgi:hypothetical protein